MLLKMSGRSPLLALSGSTHTAGPGGGLALAHRLFSSETKKKNGDKSSFAHLAAKNLSPAHIRHTDSVVVERALGCRVYPLNDSVGYLDFTSGIGVTNLGHNHPRVVAAIKEQVDRVIITQMSCYLGEKILELTQAIKDVVLPDYLDTVFFANSGTEATENAVKIARGGTNRQYVIGMEGSFHGRSYLTMALTASKTMYRHRFGPLPAGVDHVPFPYAYRMGMTDAEASAHCLRQLQYTLDSRCPASEVAAIVVEPVLGEGGYVPAPVEYLRGLQKICNDNGICLIVDEVQTGFGRTGEWFGFQHAGIRPDIVVMSKGIASGMPLAAVVSNRSLHEKLVKGGLGGTFGGSNAISAAAALATITTMREDRVIENARVQGEYLMQRLKELQTKYPAANIADIRGRGLMIGVEFTDEKGQPDVATVSAIKNVLMDNRLILLTCGTYCNVIRWIPPLIVTRDLLDEALGIFERALQHVSAAKKKA